MSRKFLCFAFTLIWGASLVFSQKVLLTYGTEVLEEKKYFQEILSFGTVEIFFSRLRDFDQNYPDTAIDPGNYDRFEKFTESDDGREIGPLGFSKNNYAIYSNGHVFIDGLEFYRFTADTPQISRTLYAVESGYVVFIHFYCSFSKDKTLAERLKNHFVFPKNGGHLFTKNLVDLALKIRRGKTGISEIDEWYTETSRKLKAIKIGTVAN